MTLIDTEESGKQLEYTSATLGRLAHFPAWEHVDRDLRHFIADDVPNGTPDEPYDDRDEGWHLVIFEDDGWVYVSEGDSHFRVRAERYREAWDVLIDELNPAT